MTGVEWADAYIESRAVVCDAVIPGLGDILRELWPDVRATFLTHALCDCDRTAPHHRWNCPATPIWAQTIRDLDTNPWTVFRTREMAAIGGPTR